MAKNSPASVGSVGSIPGQKISWRRKWQPTPVFLPGKPHEQRRPVGYSPWSHKRVRHKLATEQQGQNPGFTPLHDTHRVSEGLGGPQSPPVSCGYTALATSPTYIHGCRAFSEGQDPQEGLASASLQLLQLLCVKSQPWNFLEH